MSLKRIFQKNSRWAITEKVFFNLFLTGAVVEFSQVGAGFIDGLIIGRYLGPDALAAEGVVYPVYSVLGVISGLLAVGMELRCSRAVGRGSREEFRRFFSITAYVGGALSVIVTALMLAFARPFAVLMGASGNAAALADEGARYLVGMAPGIPALVLTAILAPALQIDSGSKTVQIGALLGTGVNVVLDIAAAKAGWGIYGIGLATAVSNCVNLLFQCTHFFRKERLARFVRPRVPLKEFVQMLANGGEKAAKRLANTIRPIVLNTIIIAYGGTAAMTALSVRNNFSSFAEIFGAGIAAAVSLMVGVYYSEINEEAIEEVSTYAQKLIFLFSGGVCVLLLLFARPVARLYVTEEGKILDMATFAVRMLALQNPLQALLTARIKYLQATRRKVRMKLLIFGTKLAAVLLSALVLGKLFGVYGILACYTVSDTLCLAAVYVFYAVSSRHPVPTAEDYMDLPESFKLSPGDVISLDIRDMDDVSLASEQIMLFCKGHKLDRKTGYYAALSFEELAGNIVKHGFPSNRDTHPIVDLRAVITDESLVIRLRDNCPRYDVTKQIAEVNAPDADPASGIGIRIVSRTAQDIRYMRSFDTNNIIITYARSPQA